MDQITYEIVNWEKYNERNDRVGNFWFRFQVDFFLNQDLYELGPNERLVFIFLMCEACRNKWHTKTIKYSCISDLTKIKIDDITQAVDNVVKSGLVRESARNGANQSEPAQISAHKTKQNKTKQYIMRERAQDQTLDKLESIYTNHYPLKIGKKKGLSLLRSRLKTEDDLVRFEAAVKNYSQFIKEHKTEQKFIKHFSTFANCWEDWISVLPSGLTKTIDPLDPFLTAEVEHRSIYG